ncbi:MAG TPA: type IV pilus secretin PilQ [Terriglobales bacterium]
MRKQLLGFMVLLLIPVLVTAGDLQSAHAGDGFAVVQKVDVLRANDGVLVEVTAHGGVTPQVTALDSPARLLISLPNTTAATARNHIDVGYEGVKGVRIGMNGQTPPVTSVVIDLAQPCSYELVPGSDKLVVKLHTAASSAKKTTPAPAASQPTEVAKAEAPAQPAPALVPITSAATVQAAPSTTASNFVMVEPGTPSTPAPADVPAVTPEARASEAASRFVDKPEGSPLPPSSASIQDQAPSTSSSATSSTASPSATTPVMTAQAGSAPAATTPYQPAVNLAAEQRTKTTQTINSASEPKYTGEPISVNLKDVDLKDFFRLIHEISGLNVVLDPNVKGTLTIVLDDVPWDQALDVVLKNNGLARQLDGNVLRIATMETLRKEADSRRAQREAEALAVDKVTFTRFMSYAHAKDMVITVKKFLTQRGDVIADERTNAVIVTDVPSVIPNVDRLLAQLDRKTQQVEIEARVVAATRTFARDIGTQLGFAFGNNSYSVGGAQQVGPSPTSTFGFVPYYPISGTSQPQATTGSQIPLFSNLGSTAPTSGINFTMASAHVRIDAVLTMAESRGLVKVLSRPRVVTQNNIQAVVKQGTRLPVVTQAQLGGPPTVTYVDAFLRLTVIPQITSEGTIFLNVDVENTTPDFSEQIQGNPALNTQQATTQVLVTDGGTVVIGGVVQTNNSINVTQVPFLGSIPWLGNLFKHTQVSTSNQELIFFITPRIIQT